MQNDHNNGRNGQGNPPGAPARGLARLGAAVAGTRLDPSRADELGAPRPAARRFTPGLSAWTPPQTTQAQPQAQAPGQASVSAVGKAPAGASAIERALAMSRDQGGERGNRPAAAFRPGAAPGSPAPAAAAGVPRGLIPLSAPTSDPIIKATQAIRYDDQQLAIIHAPEQHIVGNAFAGSGKTTTSVGRTLAHPNRRFLYLVFNAANAAEARLRFPRNVDVMTTHSLALGSPGMRQHVGTRLSRSWRAITLVQEFNLRSPAEGYHAQQVLRAFFSTTDREISDKHVVDIAKERNLSSSAAMNAVAHARLIWRDMMDPAGKCSLPDDAYLKMYALSGPLISQDEIILDEAQDANPVTVQIIGRQLKARVTCIGDTHQGIYAFRGAVNAMERLGLGAKAYYLTKTYRFGPEIAAVANTLLRELKGETHEIIGAGRPSANPERSRTVLARTNAQLFDIAVECGGVGVHWAGPTSPGGYTRGTDGPDRYRLSLLAEANALRRGDRSSISDPVLKRMPSYQAYSDYADAAQDGEARIMCKLVDRYGDDIPDLVEQIRANAVADPREAQVILTTAHKSKGAEWDNVQLANDFEFLMDYEEKVDKNPGTPLPEQEVNLLYVAVTRAKSHLQVNPDTQQWLATLEQRKRARQLQRGRETPRP